MCNDPAVTIAKAANSALPAGLQDGAVSVGYQDPDIAANQHGWEQDGYSRAWLPPQLGSHCSHSRAGNTAEGGETSLGRHVGCEGLRSAEILPKSPSFSLGSHTQKLWEQQEQLLEGEAECPGSQALLHHSSQGSSLERISSLKSISVCFYRCATATPVQHTL